MIRNLSTKWRVDVGLLGLYIVTIPLPYRYGNIALIPIALYWLGTAKFKDSWRLTKESLTIQLFILLFLIILISILTSENFDNRFSYIERYLCLVGFPIAFSSFSLSQREVGHLLQVFVAVCAICAAYSLISTLIVYDLSITDFYVPEYLSYFSWVLPETLNLKSNYYSLFVGFCLIIIAEKLLQKPPRRRQILLLLLFCFLFIFLGLLSSRTAFLAVVLLFILYLSGMIFQNKFPFRSALIIGGGLLTLIVAALQFPFLQSKIIQVLNGGLEGDPRYTLFQCGWKLFFENFLFGVGICDVKEIALACYGTFNDTEAIENKYNFHNVFLQVGVSTGIFGLIVFVALLVKLFLHAIKINRITHVGFIFLFTLCCLTESLLTRNKGLIFFTTFASLLFILKPHEKNPSR